MSMNRIPTLFFLIAFSGFTVCCENKNTTSVEIESEIFDLDAMKKLIKEKSDQFTQAHITGDTAFLNAIFSSDARVNPPNSDVITGYAAIAAGNLEWVNYGIVEFNETSTFFYGNEEYLIDEGTYYLRYGNENTIDSGKYINIWKNEDGEWKIFSNIWNSSLPLALSE